MGREQIGIDRRDRKKRVPLGVPRMKLGAPQAPGKVRRWINDSGDRLNAAQEGGYEFVTPDVQTGAAGKADLTVRESLDSRTSKVVGAKEDGSPLRAYLMEINDEWHKEDQEVKQNKIDETENALRAGADEKGSPGRDGRYVPRDGIKIERN